MRKKLIALILCLTMFTVVFAGCGNDQEEAKPTEGDVVEETIKIRLAHAVVEEDSFHIAALKFKELVEGRTNNRVEIEIFPNAVLGDERTLLEGMQIGTIDMGVITNGPVAKFLPEIAVFELPFLFGSAEEAYKILDGPIGRELLDKLETVDLKGLAFAERGFRNLTNSKRPVHTAADMEGLKIRVMENPVYIDTFKAMGADAVPMAWTEALTALQQGTIDGQENPVVVIHAFKLYETQQYLTLTRHTYAPALFITSLEVFEGLPEDIQPVFLEAAQEAAEYARKVNAENEQAQLEDLQNWGMEIIMEPDLTSFKESVQSVYDKYRDKFGEYLNRIQEELK